MIQNVALLLSICLQRTGLPKKTSPQVCLSLLINIQTFKTFVVYSYQVVLQSKLVVIIKQQALYQSFPHYFEYIFIKS